MTKRVHKIKNQPIPLACLSTHVQSMESTLEAKLAKRSKPVMAYLLVNWDSDDSVSVISQKVKGITSREGLKVSFKWPGKGIYDGTILATSGRLSYNFIVSYDS